MTNPDSEHSITKIIEGFEKSTLGMTSSPSTNLEIALDIIQESATSRAVGQMVFVFQEEDGREVLLLGQIVEVTTKNRWHEDMAFKGVIKRHKRLPNLSGSADNRLAMLSVQSSFDFQNDEPVSHILGVSPSTGLDAYKMTNEVMQKLVAHHGLAITYIGKVYGTDVHLPMWFKHFDKDEADNELGIPGLGAGDTYHVGVFGKTGSGKTVTAAFMLLAYAKNKANINILVLDPQSQFTHDRELLPDEVNFQEEIKKTGMEYKKFNLVNDVALRPDDLHLLGRLLMSNKFFEETFGPFYSPGKEEDMRDCIIDYLEGRSNEPRFSIASPKGDLLSEMLKAFSKEGEQNKYVKRVYGSKTTQQRLAGKIETVIASIDRYRERWDEVLELFDEEKEITIDALVEEIVSDIKGKFIVLDMGPRQGELENENMQAVFLNVIERRIAYRGSILYSKGKRANCLIVMDEAHRYVDRKSADKMVSGVSNQIIDSVRTTRKYGIGHMFITQSLESLDDEIVKQMRLFAFGHGLTTGGELRKVGEIINNPAALGLYKSFIDPGNRKQYPFMFFGPMSPLSATGAPVFVEIYTRFQDYKTQNGMASPQPDGQSWSASDV